MTWRRILLIRIFAKIKLICSSSVHQLQQANIQATAMALQAQSSHIFYLFNVAEKGLYTSSFIN